MPSGGLMQLVSRGSENMYLTGNPQITFLKLLINGTQILHMSGYQNILRIHQIIIQLEQQL